MILEFCVVLAPCCLSAANISLLERAKQSKNLLFTEQIAKYTAQKIKIKSKIVRNEKTKEKTEASGTSVGGIFQLC